MVASQKRASQRARSPKPKEDTLFDVGSVSAPRNGHGKAFDPTWVEHEKPEVQISFEEGDRVRVTLDPAYLGREGVVVIARQFTTTVRLEDGSENTWGNGGLELIEESIASPVEAPANTDELEISIAKPEVQFSFPDLESLDLPQLEQTIAQLHTQADEALETSIAAAKSETLLRRYEGLALIAVKQKLGHGEWEPWLIEFAKGRGVGDRQVRIYIQLARNWDDSFAEMPLNGAIEQIRKVKRLQRSEQIAFLPDGDEPEMQTRSPITPDVPLVVGQPLWRNGLEATVTQIPNEDEIVVRFGDGKYERMKPSDFDRVPPLPSALKMRSCLDCQHCEVMADLWHCHKHNTAYAPSDNPAPGCAQFLGQRNEQPKSIEPRTEELTPVQRHKSTISPAQRAIEKIILECSKECPGVSFFDLAKVLIGWCGEDEQESIGQWISDRLGRAA